MNPGLPNDILFKHFSATTKEPFFGADAIDHFKLAINKIEKSLESCRLFALTAIVDYERQMRLYTENKEALFRTDKEERLNNFDFRPKIKFAK